MLQEGKIQTEMIPIFLSANSLGKGRWKTHLPWLRKRTGMCNKAIHFRMECIIYRLSLRKPENSLSETLKWSVTYYFVCKTFYKKVSWNINEDGIIYKKNEMMHVIILCDEHTNCVEFIQVWLTLSETGGKNILNFYKYKNPKNRIH